MTEATTMIRLSHWRATFAPLLLAASVGALAPLARSAEEPSNAGAQAPWRNPNWRERYRVVFDNVGEESGAEVAVARFRPNMERRGNPYDLRAIADDGTVLPVEILYWSPPQAAPSPLFSDVTCLIGLDAAKATDSVSLFLYADNPAPPPAFYNYDWRSPSLLIGSDLKRDLLRHGEWIWRPDARFGAVHVGLSGASSSPSKNGVQAARSTHSVTGFPALSCHPRRMRLIQMVWVDPSDPPEAICLSLVFEDKMQSVFWTNGSIPQEMPGASQIGVASQTANAPQGEIVGALPSPGKWTPVIVTGASLGLEKPELLSGIGFSNYGGTVKWGPTALGAMPTYGRVTLRQRLSVDDAGTTRIETLPLEEATTGPSTIENLRLDLTGAPLFVEHKAPLFLTYFLAPAYKFTGQLPRCEVEIASVAPDGRETLLERMPAPFVGGDNWQQTIELSPSQWEGAARIQARLIANGQRLETRSLLLAPLGKVEGLAPNGELLQAGEDVVTFVVTPETPKAATEKSPATTFPSAPAVLLFTPSLNDRLPTGTVSINSDDPRLGLPERVSPFTRRTAAEWVVVATRVIGSRDFSNARIVVENDSTDIGISLHELSLYLRGLIRLLQCSPSLRVEMDLSSLREQPETMNRHERAMLGVCLEAQALLEQSK